MKKQTGTRRIGQDDRTPTFYLENDTVGRNRSGFFRLERMRAYSRQQTTEAQGSLACFQRDGGSFRAKRTHLHLSGFAHGSLS
jgi:hypothetical protein